MVDVQERLFVPLQVSRFDRAKARRWRATLERALRDRRLAPAFDAVERIQSGYDGSDVPDGRYSEDPIEHIDGELRIVFRLSRPRDMEDGGFNADAWIPHEPFLWSDPLGIFNQFLKGRLEEERDRIFQEEIAPRIAEAFVQRLTFHLVEDDDSTTPVELDATLVSSYEEGVPLYVSLRPGETPPPIPRERIARFEIHAEEEIPPHSKAILRSGAVRYRTAHMRDVLFKDRRILNDLVPSDPVRISTPPSRTELRNPRDDDRRRARLLIGHLNEHLEYYHKVIWWRMGPDRRYMLLDGFVAPNSNGRSVASVVENRLIGIVGNSLVMPVAPGL